MRVSLSALVLGGCLVAPVLAGAEPMDLRDTRPRAVSVRFENSSADAPERLAEQFTGEISARLETSSGGEVVVRVAGRDVERGYFYRQRLQPGSFSDYVWVFDPASGHVLSASLQGTLIRRLELGPFAKDIDTAFDAKLSTLGLAGFAPARKLLGQRLFPLCKSESSACTLVPAARYDASTGYVNAIGWFRGRALGVSAQHFAAIGEAIFSELPRAATAGLADVR